jgi:transposase
MWRRFRPHNSEELPTDLSAWIGLVPKQNSSAGKDKLGNISKQGDRYLRSLFTTGALAVIR